MFAKEKTIMDQDNREHHMVAVDYPAVSFAKKVCYLVMALCIIGLALWYINPWPLYRLLFHEYEYCFIGIAGGIVAIAAIRAFIQAFSR
jgi:hypothetical protein